MLSYQIQEELEKIMYSLDEASYFFECLETITSNLPEVNEYIQEIASGNIQVVNQLKNKLSQTKQSMNSVKPRSFFASIEKLQNDLKGVLNSGFNDLSQSEQIIIKLDDFTHTYEAFIGSYSPSDAANMIVEAQALSSLLNGFKHGLLFYLANIKTEESIENEEDYGHLSIVLLSSMTLDEFISKLNTIKEMYSEVSVLIEDTHTSYPMKVSKIEYGSLWIDFLGKKGVILLLREMINEGCGFFYRNYTNEGKIKTIPKTAEGIETLLKLKSKLDEQGIDTSNMGEHISKAAAKLSGNLNALLSDQSEIIIDNEKIPLINVPTNNHLEAKKPTLGITDSSD